MRPLTKEQQEALKEKIIWGANYKPQYIEVKGSKEISEITHKRFLELPDELQGQFQEDVQGASVGQTDKGEYILTVKKTPLTMKVFKDYIINEFWKGVNMKVITVLISDNLYDRLLYLSYRLKKNRSQIIRDLINEKSIEEYTKEKGKNNARK